MSFGEVIAVDYHQRLLDELASNFRVPHLKLVKNNGSDFPGVESASADYVFSFGVFVHLDLPVIEQYLVDIHRVLRSGGTGVLQYSDKTKAPAQADKTFAENDPVRMRKAVHAAGFQIVEEELAELPHSSIVRFRK